MAWSDLWAMMGSGAGTGTTPAAPYLGGTGEGWMSQQALLEAAPGAVGPQLPQKNLGLPDANNGLTPDPNKGGLGHWWRETGGGNLKGPDPQQQLGAQRVQQLVQGAQGLARQAQPAPQPMAPAGGAMPAPHSPAPGGAPMQQPAGLLAMPTGNPYLQASPLAQRALQLQRGLLDG